MTKFNKRTIILVLILTFFIILIVANNIIKNNQNVTQSEQPSYEEYLDNGIQFAKIRKEGKYLENIVITNIVLNDNHIEYTLKNYSDSIVYISNQISIVIGEDCYNYFDETEGKIELKSREEKIINIGCTINDKNKKLGYRVDKTMQISILKPIYIKYDDSELLGIAKG